MGNLEDAYIVLGTQLILPERDFYVRTTVVSETGTQP